MNGEREDCSWPSKLKDKKIRTGDGQSECGDADFILAWPISVAASEALVFQKMSCLPAALQTGAVTGRRKLGCLSVSRRMTASPLSARPAESKERLNEAKVEA